MKKKNFTLSIITIAQVVLLLIIASYAWFSDKSNPSISENNIQVSSAQGLVIKLAPDSEARTTVNLNELLSDFDSFELKQMSSSNATDFYLIDFGAGLANNLPMFTKIIPDDVTNRINMETYGCIDYNFYLQTEDFAKHVYFHKDSYITGAAANAIRVAITVNDVGYDFKKIFGTVRENGITDEFTTKAVIAEGEFEYSDLDNDLVSNQVVYTFSDYNGGRGTSDDISIDLSKVLFTIAPNTAVKVNVKVWLEGGDEDCDNDISDTTIDTLIKFGSANVLRDAPNVYANNSLKTITNLTTEMEFAYTNDENTEWTTVTNLAMHYTAGSTVYVRYKEIEGVSPCSYITTVIFNG